jgi:very-short-patch-repair endonuclease
MMQRIYNTLLRIKNIAVHGFNTQSYLENIFIDLMCSNQRILSEQQAY